MAGALAAALLLLGGGVAGCGGSSTAAGSGVGAVGVGAAFTFRDGRAAFGLAHVGVGGGRLQKRSIAVVGMGAVGSALSRAVGDSAALVHGGTDLLRRGVNAKVATAGGENRGSMESGGEQRGLGRARRLGPLILRVPELLREREWESEGG